MGDLDHDSDRLMAALPWNARKTQLEPVLRAATFALRALARLDEIIFERRTGSGGLVVDVLAQTRKDVDGKASRFLRGVAREMWGGANQFIAVTRHQLEGHFKSDEDQGEVDLDAFNFDLTGPIREITEIGEGDIEDALNELAEPEGEMISLAAVAKVTVPLVRALRGELEQAKVLLLDALEQEAFAQAVQTLDRTRDGLEEAIFAVVEAIFELHHAPLSREELVPGYQSALDEALSLRKAIAALRRGVARDNDAVKGGDAEAFARNRERINAFLQGSSFGLMRAADRMQLLELRKRLSAGDDKLAVEGLAKYLESLSAINDREVLVQHDRRAREEARLCLESARSLFEISPRAAAEQVATAYEVARGLEGWRDDLDALLAEWQRDPQRLLVEETAETWADKLVPLL